MLFLTKITEYFEDVELPVKLFIPITAIYLLICTVIILIFDRNRNVLSGMTFGDAFYFWFVFIRNIQISF